MVAESNPARQRADSTPSTSSTAAVRGDASTLRRVFRRAPRAPRRARVVVAGLALAALAGAAAAPLAANAGVDPASSIQAMLGLGDTGVSADSRTAASPVRSVVDEEAGLRVRVSPTISTTVSLGAPVALSVELENATGEAVAPGTVRLVRTEGAIDDQAELDEWLASDAQDGTGIAAPAVTLGEGESRGLAAGGATVVSFTVPGEAFADLAASPVLGLGAELRVGETVVAAGTAAYANADVPAAGSVAVALAAPLTTPTGTAPEGLIPADQLANWTSPTGLLTRQLDALAGRRVAIGLDPRIVASIRVLGTSAPPTATAWLQRLADVPNEVFPLAYADADLAAQAQLGLPALLAPTSFSDVLDPADFAAVPEGEEDGAGAAEPGQPTQPPATDEPGGTTETQPTPGGVPTTQELLAWPYTRTDLAWPADDTITTGNLGYLDAAGLTTTILAPGNVEAVDAPASSSATIDGSTALVADGELTEPLRAASDATTDTAWREATGRLLAELALDAGSSRTTVLATFARGDAAQSTRVAGVIDEIAGSNWSSLAGLADAIGAPPEARTLIDEPEPEGRLATISRLVETEASLASFATVLADESLITGPTRRQLLALLDVAWLEDPAAWESEVGDWLAEQRETLGAVSVVQSSTINVVSTETGVPTTIENTLPYPVTVVVDVNPSNGRLIVEDQVEATVEPESRSTVRVPVAAGVGNGEVSLAVSLTSTQGVPIGQTVIIPANVQADWEGVGAAILGAIVVLVFGIGLWRNIRRRRRARADAAGETDNASDDAGAEPSDTDAAEQTPSESDASTETRADAHAPAATADDDATDTHAPDTDTTGPERG